MNCVVTGLPMNVCEHCSSDTWIEIEEPGIEYEVVGRAFKTEYKGTCVVERRHDIKRGDLVSKVQRSDNPAIVVPGVACKHCTLTLPKGKTR